MPPFTVRTRLCYRALDLTHGLNGKPVPVIRPLVGDIPVKGSPRVGPSPATAPVRPPPMTRRAQVRPTNRAPVLTGPRDRTGYATRVTRVARNVTVHTHRSHRSIE